MADFAGSIRGPATAVYAFGVLLPLALVSLPGAPRCWPSRTASGRRRRLRCLATALCLLGASAWLLARRPVAFPPTTVERSHPDVPARRWPGPVVGFLAAALSWWCVPLVFRRGRHRSPWPVLGPEPHSSFTTGRSSRYADQWVPSRRTERRTRAARSSRRTWRVRRIGGGRGRRRRSGADERASRRGPLGASDCSASAWRRPFSARTALSKRFQATECAVARP